MESFNASAERMAKYIEEGGLAPTEDSSYDPLTGRQWVHKAAWRYLAQVNRQGLLTFGSQDARDPVTGVSKPWQRSYVVGYMPTDEAEKFVATINTTYSDRLGIIDIIVPDRSPIWTKRKGLRIGTNAYYNEILGRWDTRGGAGYIIKPHIDEIKVGFSLPDDFSLSEVQIIDLVWGRAADRKNGLFSIILDCLNDTSITERELHADWLDGR
jgi:hypothetical protein